jgi:hypothetical protein
MFVSIKLLYVTSYSFSEVIGVEQKRECRFLKPTMYFSAMPNTVVLRRCVITQNLYFISTDENPLGPGSRVYCVSLVNGTKYTVRNFITTFMETC